MESPSVRGRKKRGRGAGAGGGVEEQMEGSWVMFVCRGCVEGVLQTLSREPVLGGEGPGAVGAVGAARVGMGVLPLRNRFSLLPPLSLSRTLTHARTHALNTSSDQVQGVPTRCVCLFLTQTHCLSHTAYLKRGAGGANGPRLSLSLFLTHSLIHTHTHALSRTHTH